MDIQILIVDDHPAVRESLRLVFGAAGMKQIMEATTCAQAKHLVRDRNVDLVLLDVALRDGHGLDALREIKAIDDSIPVLIHSYCENARLLSRGFHLGAAGYVVKGKDKNALLHAVRQAASGASLWTAEQRMQIRQVDTELGEFDAATSAVCGAETNRSIREAH